MSVPAPILEKAYSFHGRASSGFPATHAYMKTKEDFWSKLFFLLIARYSCFFHIK